MVVRPVAGWLFVASRVAAIGLAIVLLVLGGFAIWSSNRSVDAAAQLKRAQRISSAYAHARFAMDDERLVEHEYMVGHDGNYTAANSPRAHARFESFASAASSALLALAQVGDLNDRRLAGDMLTRQREYHRATEQVFMAAMARDQSMAEMRGSMASQSFSELNRELATASEARAGESVAKLNSLQHTERGISKSTIETVPLALVLVTLFGLVLRTYRRRVQDYTQAELKRLKEDALVDSLTQLRNHRAFEEDLDRVLAQANRSGGPATLIAIDLDHLKHTNDTLGHPVGDERLKALAAAARRVTRTGDGAYRNGGDEFALILPNTRASGGYAIHERLRAELSRLTGGRQTATAGIAEFGPGMSRDAFVHNADVALLEAKMSRCGSVVYSSELERGEDGAPVDGTSLPLRSVSSALARAIDAKDSAERSHSETVARTCVQIANELGFDAERTGRLRAAGLLHDIGKIGVPDKVLQKPGPLTDDEWELMRTHPVVGHGILLAAGQPDQALWVLHHHERIDGGGYPDGISGEAIPLESRIIHVAAAFEAMTHDRPHCKGRDQHDALEELERNAGTQFDPACVRALRHALERTSDPIRA